MGRGMRARAGDLGQVLICLLWEVLSKPTQFLPTAKRSSLCCSRANVEHRDCTLFCCSQRCTATSPCLAPPGAAVGYSPTLSVCLSRCLYHLVKSMHLGICFSSNPKVGEASERIQHAKDRVGPFNSPNVLVSWRKKQISFTGSSLCKLLASNWPLWCSHSCSHMQPQST